MSVLVEVRDSEKTLLMVKYEDIVNVMFGGNLTGKRHISLYLKNASNSASVVHNLEDIHIENFRQSMKDAASEYNKLLMTLPTASVSRITSKKPVTIDQKGIKKQTRLSKKKDDVKGTVSKNK